MSRSRNPERNHSLNANRNYGNATRPRLHNRKGSRSIDCLLRDGCQAARHRACPRLRRQGWPRKTSRPQGLRSGRPRILLGQAGRCGRQGCAYRLCRQERGRGERVLRGSNGGGRDRPRQAQCAPVLRSPLLRCERFRSRRLQSRSGPQELATPPIIEPRNEGPLRQSHLHNLTTEIKQEKIVLNIAIILGSTQPGRNGEAVAKWVHEIAKKRTDAEFELVDIKDFNLPLLDEPMPPIMGQYSKPHTKAWAAKIGEFDAYVFVTPEYNHGISGALKNAIDFLFREWNDKAAGFVSYGGAGGARAVEQLRLVLAEVQMATVRLQVLLSMYTDFENFSVFKPDARHEKSVNEMFDQVIAWGGALKALREKRA